ncbi:MAG: hypothetical protein EPO32_01785 [Anaerolineae bacterium]|nr:MAG: hypothetical protein EPO32_01785 [Anaerolineae bacterium]
MFVEGSIMRAIALAEGGDRRTAAGLLAGWVKANPESELGWYWLGQCVEDIRQKRQCFERVLALNPQHDQALRQLVKLEADLRPTAPVAVYQPDLSGMVVAQPALDVRDELCLDELPKRPLLTRILGPALVGLLALAVLVFAWLALAG